MTVLVLGASSQIGLFLLPRLRAAGRDVVAVSRDTHADEAGVRWLVGALPEQMPTLPSVQAIISFGPIVALADWLETAELPNLQHVVATSSMSAESKRDAVDPAERATSQALRDGEAALAAICEQRNARWTVLRPTLIYGAGLDKSLSPLARQAMRRRVFPLPAGSGLRQPVHADDIAAAAVAALTRPQACGRIIPLGGGERLSAAQMFARVRRSLPCTTVPVPVPRWLLALAQRLAPRARGPISRLGCDLIADNTVLETVLDIHPRAFLVDAARWTPR
jgi:nucleoside-diphosphate-sugar epimerase